MSTFAFSKKIIISATLISLPISVQGAGNAATVQQLLKSWEPIANAVGPVADIAGANASRLQAQNEESIEPVASSFTALVGSVANTLGDDMIAKAAALSAKHSDYVDYVTWLKSLADEIPSSSEAASFMKQFSPVDEGLQQQAAKHLSKGNSLKVAGGALSAGVSLYVFNDKVEGYLSRVDAGNARLADHLTIGKDAIVTAWSAVPVAGTIIGATDLAVDGAAWGIDKYYDKARSISEEFDAELRQYSSNSLTVIRQHVDEAAKDGVNLSTEQLIHIIKKQGELLERIVRAKEDSVPNSFFDGDVAVKAYNEILDFALSLQNISPDDPWLKQLEVSSKELTLAYGMERLKTKKDELLESIDELADTAQKIEQFEEDLAKLVRITKEQEIQLDSEIGLLYSENDGFQNETQADDSPKLGDVNQTNYKEKYEQQELESTLPHSGHTDRESGGDAIDIETSGNLSLAYSESNMATLNISLVKGNQQNGFMQTSAQASMGPGHTPREIENVYEPDVAYGAEEFSYTEWGRWSGNDPDYPFYENKSGYVVLGVPTPDDYLPDATGTATYTGDVMGAYSGGSYGDGYLGGRTRLTADFDTNTIEGALFLNRIYSAGETEQMRTVTFEYAIDQQGGYGGMLTVDGNPVAGQLYGEFYGPKAEETGGAFVFSHQDAGNQHELVEGVYRARQ